MAERRPIYCDTKTWRTFGWDEPVPTTWDTNCRWCRAPFEVSARPGRHRHTCDCGGVTVVDVASTFEMCVTASVPLQPESDGHE